jgi:hypothetical protein
LKRAEHERELLALALMVAGYSDLELARADAIVLIFFFGGIK